MPTQFKASGLVLAAMTLTMALAVVESLWEIDWLHQSRPRVTAVQLIAL